MPPVDKIRSFDDAERAQEINEYRFADIYKILREVAESRKETEAEFRKTDAQIRKTEAQIRETNAQSRKTDAQIRKTEAQLEKTDAKLREIGIQLGNFGNTRGEFVEHLAMPSIERIVKEQLKADFLGGLTGSYNGVRVQIDAWAKSDQDKAAFVFEIKHKFSDEALSQVFRQIGNVRVMFPELALTPIYPFIAVGIINSDDEEKVWQAGVQLLRFGADTFRLCQPPEGFKPIHTHGMNGHGRFVPAPYPHYLRELTGGSGPQATVH
ncbi:MAG: hypothetical protein OXI60_00610 [Acidiferrobacterales bacterium]|nr:hypothetical protein [Acidiferrobacterales bacterium]